MALTLVRCVTSRIRASPTPLLSRPPPPGACFRVRGRAVSSHTARASLVALPLARARRFAAAAGGRRAARAPLDRDGVDVVRVRARLECLDGVDAPGRSVVRWVGSGRVGSRSVRRPPWRVWSGLVWSGLWSVFDRVCTYAASRAARATVALLHAPLLAPPRRRASSSCSSLTRSLVSRLLSLISRLSSLVSLFLALSRSPLSLSLGSF